MGMQDAGLEDREVILVCVRSRLLWRSEANGLRPFALSASHRTDRAGHAGVRHLNETRLLPTGAGRGTRRWARP